MSYADFCKAARRICFDGDKRRVWLELDPTRSGKVMLADLDAKIASELHSFHTRITARYGTVELAEAQMGLQHGKRLKRHDFCKLVWSRRLVATSNAAEELFNMLAEIDKVRGHAFFTCAALRWLYQIAHALKSCPTRHLCLSATPQRSDKIDNKLTLGKSRIARERLVYGRTFRVVAA